MEFNFDQIKDGYVATFKKYNDFNGRSTREEFWTFFFCNLAINIAAGIVISILSFIFGFIPFIGWLMTFMLYGLLGLFALATLVPNIAVGVRRLHDTDRSGMFWLLVFACCIGVFVPLYWSTQEGTVGENQFGPDPKAAPQP